MKLSIVTVAEPCPPPVRIGAPWRRRHGPNEDADEYCAVSEPISLAPGMKHYMAAHPTGPIAIASHLRTGVAHVAVGSAAANIVHGSTAPALAVPVR